MHLSVSGFAHHKEWPKMDTVPMEQSEKIELFCSQSVNGRQTLQPVHGAVEHANQQVCSKHEDVTYLICQFGQSADLNPWHHHLFIGGKAKIDGDVAVQSDIITLLLDDKLKMNMQ